MDDIVYDDFNIDVSDIWKYESDHFYAERNDENKCSTMEELYFVIQKFYLKAEHRPFLKLSDVGAGKEKWETYERYDKGYKLFTKDHTVLKSGATIKYFKWRGNFYEMSGTCIVSRKDTIKEDFEKLFALKLRQYVGSLSSIEDFLKFQLKTNFNNNFSSFQKFMKYIFLQHENLLQEKIIDITKEWINNKEIKLNSPKVARKEKSKPEGDAAEKITVAILQKDDLPSSPQIDVAAPSGNSDTDNPGQSEFNIPEGYKVIPGNFSLEEINYFFSFLYREESVGGSPFLKEESVKEIFKYGIAIPPVQPEAIYEIKHSRLFPIKIITYSIHVFFSIHSTDLNAKKNILLFFANYFKNFHQALDSETQLLNWNKNVTHKKPSRMKFSINNYLPARFQNSKIYT